MNETGRMAGAPPPRNLRRSTGAVLAGFVAVAVVSLGTDQLLHVVDFYPPWGEPMWDPVQNAVALAYRLVFAVLGSYLTARLAPRNPMRHALVLGAVGLVASTLGAIGAAMAQMGPLWYPIALVVTALPCAWAGGWLHAKVRGGA